LTEYCNTVFRYLDNPRIGDKARPVPERKEGRDARKRNLCSPPLSYAYERLYRARVSHSQSDRGQRMLYIGNFVSSCFERVRRKVTLFG